MSIEQLMGIPFSELFGFDPCEVEATAEDLANYTPEEDEAWLDELRALPR